MISHRATRSSRHPGTKFEGNVNVHPRLMENCAKCGGAYLSYSYRPEKPLPHAPHFDAQLRLVDCVGDEVQP